eukprot:TRINITY_DN5645_c0_g2_i14.p1 TRINITY_DN5645_c0_g2~~TRINITY_DN5645_c0_g2_i14.p1  ORF type:complete len:103 (+),score=19.33 TRINITY_DN5645_c0_g2_i14:138-446(+)
MGLPLASIESFAVAAPTRLPTICFCTVSLWHKASFESLFGTFLAIICGWGMCYMAKVDIPFLQAESVKIPLDPQQIDEPSSHVSPEEEIIANTANVAQSLTL